MKNGILILLTIGVIITNEIKAEGGAYERTMGQNIGLIFTSETIEDMDALANKFVRIGETESDKWLPFYYASMTKIFKSFRLKEATEKDKALQHAQTQLDKALELDSENSEIYALQGFLYMISLSVDPANRGQSMSPKAFAQFEQSLAIESSNPRALLFKGQMMYGAAQFFGSGTELACGLVLKSIELFENDKRENSILPSWGLTLAHDYRTKCNQDAKPVESKDD